MVSPVNIIPPLLSILIYISSGGGTISPLEAAVQIPRFTSLI
jgi:hypothetical protein